MGFLQCCPGWPQAPTSSLPSSYNYRHIALCLNKGFTFFKGLLKNKTKPKEYVTKTMYGLRGLKYLLSILFSILYTSILLKDFLHKFTASYDNFLNLFIYLVALRVELRASHLLAT
jgi:hypothetical protein